LRGWAGEQAERERRARRTHIAVRWSHDLRVLQLDGDANIVSVQLLLAGVPLVHLRVRTDLAHVA